MPKSRRRPGQSRPFWTVVLDTTDGRQTIPRYDETEAISVSEKYEASPRGTHGAYWMAVGGVVLGPDGEEIHRWGRDFDPDAPPRWPGLQQTEDGGTCANGCSIARGRFMLNGRCLNCVYAADAEPRPYRIAQPPWDPTRDEIKKKAETDKAAKFKEPERFRYNPRRYY